MKRLIAFIVGAVLLFVVATTASAMWLDSNHWIDENMIVKFKGNTVYVWEYWPEFGGTIYIGEWTKEEANQYVDWWYYTHSI
jgi:hypothetical protein